MAIDRAWLSTAEVVKTYGNCSHYWVKLAKAGKVSAHLGGKFLYERESIDDFLRGKTANKKAPTTVKREIDELKEKIELLETRKALEVAQSELRSIDEYKRSITEFIPKQQSLERREALLNQKEAKCQADADAIARREAKVIKAVEWINKNGALIVKDSKALITLHNELVSSGYAVNAKVKECELELSDEYYRGDIDIEGIVKGICETDDKDKYELEEED